MPSEKITPALREAAKIRARGLCEYCRSPFSYSPGFFVADHVFPKSLGGKTSLANLAFACSNCNGFKSQKIKAADPLTKRMVRLFNPRRQKWADHFEWSEDGTLVIGLTATGRATVMTLRLNREELINIRELLVRSNLHPPA